MLYDSYMMCASLFRDEFEIPRGEHDNQMFGQETHELISARDHSDASDIFLAA
jgi:hypothetical protein